MVLIKHTVRVTEKTETFDIIPTREMWSMSTVKLWTTYNNLVSKTVSLSQFKTFLWCSADDELRNFTAREKKLLYCLVWWQQIHLYCQMAAKQLAYNVTFKNDLTAELYLLVVLLWCGLVITKESDNFSLRSTKWLLPTTKSVSCRFKCKSGVWAISY